MVDLMLLLPLLMLLVQWLVQHHVVVTGVSFRGITWNWSRHDLQFYRTSLQGQKFNRNNLNLPSLDLLKLDLSFLNQE